MRNQARGGQGSANNGPHPCALPVSRSYSSVSRWAGAARAESPILTGTAAFGDWRRDAPGVVRHIDVGDLPKPYATQSAGNPPASESPAPDAAPKVPDGFTVSRFASGLDGPRLIRVAPNGDIFVAETDSGTIRVLRAADGATKVETSAIYADDLEAPFGIAFYPPGPAPKWLYVAETNAIVRYPYTLGDMAASGKPESIVGKLVATRGGHSTRDIRFSPDGSEDVRLRRLGVQRRRRHGQARSRQARGMASRARSRRILGRRDGPRRRPRLRSRRDRIARCLPPASAIASGWRFNPRAERSGARPTSATASATTSCPTT